MKRSEHLEPLSHDHFEGLLVAGRLRKGLSRGASPALITAFVVYFWNSHLDLHFYQEEDILLPLMNTRTTAVLADRLVDEHRRIRALVERVEAAPDDSTRTLEELADLLKSHIRFEERELFPALENELPEQVLSEIGRQLQQDHVTTELTWTPAFWE